MSNKNKNKDKIIIKHILEVRLSKRLFSFMDFKGELLDFMIKNLKADKVRFVNSGTRIDVASDDLLNVFFISYENFGIQIDGVESFDEFREQVSKIIEVIKLFGKYKIDSVVRIGTKSSILYHKGGDSYETLKQKYKDFVFGNYKVMEGKTNTQLSDVAYVFDLKRENGVANVLTGPVTKEEAMQKFFGNGQRYEKFNVSNGFFFDIDFAKNGNKEISSLDELAEEIKDNIKNIEEIFNGFLDYFNDNNYGQQ
jgi:hypothetical protein